VTPTLVTSLAACLHSVACKEVKNRQLLWLRDMLCACLYKTLSCLLSDGLLRSYCQWETFNATCYNNDVIIITSASYGRMRIGRCLTVQYAIGCMADVTDDVDRRCSGRQNCTIRVPDADLFSLQPCRKDLIAYMETAYKCVTRK